MIKEANILIIEDEDVTRLSLQNLFEGEGYRTHLATNGEEILSVIEAHNIDLVLMDINLPGKNGLILAREVLQKHQIGLMFVTSRDSEVDKVLGLEIGADDYITKPFNPRELTIRVRNLLNRLSRSENHATTAEEDTTVIQFDNWKLDPNSRQMISPQGKKIAIPRGEYRALRLLMENRGKIVSRQELIRRMTGRELRENDRTVDVTIRRLRKHFESDEQSPEFINTIHGEGYRFVGNLDS